MITGGSSVDFDTKRQKRNHYRSINHVAITGPVVQTKWSHVSLTFDARDVDLRSAPHIDAMVTNTTELTFFAECLRHSAKAILHSAKAFDECYTRQTFYRQRVISGVLFSDTRLEKTLGKEKHSVN
jgi:hypothetical protein